VEFLHAGLHCATIGGSAAVSIVVAVLNPLADIACHIEETKCVRAVAANRSSLGIFVIAVHKPGCGDALGLGREIGAIAITALVGLEVASIPGSGCTRACGVFPFGFAQ
jgi:hypothetical protein